MTVPTDSVRAYVTKNRSRYLERLQRLCAQPGLSATGEGMRDALEVTLELMAEVGMEISMWETPGYPAVLGVKGNSESSLGVYGHYDVQPVDPIEAWHTDPFDMTASDGRLYARGVADTKGHLVARLCAIEAYEACLGELPLSIKVFVEGEEEVGSPNLGGIARAHEQDLDADGYLWESGHVSLEGVPTVYLGMKGMLTLKLGCQGARTDLHSMYGPVVPNPLWQLVWGLGTILGKDYRIKLPGFYDLVRPVTDWDRQAIRTISSDPKELAQLFGIERFVGGLEGDDVLMQLVVAPSCTINGWWGGYSRQEGTKTVLPSQGGVSLDFRLVPDQDPEDLAVRLRDYLEGLQLDITVSISSSMSPARTDPDDPFVGALLEACKQGYGRQAGIYPMLPASGPMYELCQKYGRAAAGGAGMIRPDSNVHAPNENIREEDFLHAIVSTVLLIQIFGSGRQGKEEAV